jgi:hypothetical protein
VKRVKRQVSDHEKIFVNHRSDQEPLSTTYKEHSKSNKKITNPTQNGKKILIDTSAKKAIWMVNHTRQDERVLNTTNH